MECICVWTDIDLIFTLLSIQRQEFVKIICLYYYYYYYYYYYLELLFRPVSTSQLSHLYMPFLCSQKQVMKPLIVTSTIVAQIFLS
jgi:hypothetical protein